MRKYSASCVHCVHASDWWARVLLLVVGSQRCGPKISSGSVRSGFTLASRITGGATSPQATDEVRRFLLFQRHRVPQASRDGELTRGDPGDR